MKKILIFIFAFVMFYSGCIYKNSEKLNKDTKETGKDIFSSSIGGNNDPGYIVYGRYGGEKEICSVNSTGKRHIDIYQGDYDKANGYEDKIVLYSKTEEEKGIYLIDVNEKKPTLIIDGFRLTQRPCFSKDGSLMAFYAYPKYDPADNEQYKQRLYYMNFNEKEPARIKNVEGEIKHISFIDNDGIIYSKSIQGKGAFQIYKYSIGEGVETPLIKSDYNNVNPVVSPDGGKVAFLSDKYSNYNLYVLNLSDNSIQELDTDNAVVGESVAWSPDGSKIVYVTLSGVAKYSVRLADVRQNTTISVGNGYIAAFSPSGKNIVYAVYEINSENESEKSQTIYKMNIEEENTEKVWDFPESSVFSRSINVLYWTDSLDMK